MERRRFRTPRRAGFPSRCSVVEDEYNMVKITVDSYSASVLIGRRGSTIDAVEHLVERMTNQAIGTHAHMNLDINNYRRRREDSLVERARGVVAKVQATGREVHLEPLCARERRIIHLEVAKAEGLRTYTIATSSGKHVVVAKEGSDSGSAAAARDDSGAEPRFINEEKPAEGNATET